MAGLGYGEVRNAKLVDLQAHYEPDLVRRAWATSGLPDWAPTEPANAGVALDRTWAATIGVAMGAVAAKDAMPAPTRQATKANSGWIATREWTRMPGPHSALLVHGQLPYVQAGASPTDMLLYAASDAAATLALGFLMETLRLEPTVTWTEGKKRFATRMTDWERGRRDVFLHRALPPPPERVIARRVQGWDPTPLGDVRLRQCLARIFADVAPACAGGACDGCAKRLRGHRGGSLAADVMVPGGDGRWREVGGGGGGHQ